MKDKARHMQYEASYDTSQWGVSSLPKPRISKVPEHLRIRILEAFELNKGIWLAMTISFVDPVVLQAS
jgi:hypothetical protein